MYNGTKPEYIDHTELLNNINQEEVMFQYLGIWPDLYKKFKSPFRIDRDAGCRFEWKNGMLCFVDNTAFNGRLYWNIFHIVMYQKSCSFQEACKHIAKGRYSPIKSIPVEKPKLEIKFTYKPWQENLFGLSNEILLSEHVYLVEDYWAYRNYWRKNFLHQSLCIAYHFPKTNHVKLYFPEEKEDRWYSNCSNQDIYGLDTLISHGDLLIISKSQKDRLALKYDYGFENVIAVQNEGCFIPDDIIIDLKLRFKRIVVIFDNDLTGYEQAQKLSQKYNIEYKIIENDQKDIFDMKQKKYLIYNA